MDTLLYVCRTILRYICRPDGSHSLAAAAEEIRWTLCNPFDTIPDRLSRLSVFNSTVHLAELAWNVLGLLTPPELWGHGTFVFLDFKAHQWVPSKTGTTVGCQAVHTCVDVCTGLWAHFYDFHSFDQWPVCCISHCSMLKLLPGN